MVATVDLMEDDEAQIAYMIALDGLPTLYVTDHPGGALLGSGAGSWIHGYENQRSVSWETAGERTVKGGLKVPQRIPLGKSVPKTGMLAATSARFELLDDDGSLAALFATEGKDVELLAQRVPPGQTALGTAVSVQNGAGTSNPRGRNIGIERIGPAGERRFFHCFPFQGIGLDHPYPLVNADDAPRPSVLSDDPVEHAGRWVAVYRLHRDWTIDSFTAASWGLWDEQYDAGVLAFFGRMRDQATYKGDRIWSLECDGWEGPLKRRSGALLSPTWNAIDDSTIVLSAEQRLMALELGFAEVALQGSEFNAGDYHVHYSIGFSEQLPASGTRTAYIEAIQAVIDDVVSNTTSEYGTDRFDSFRDQKLEIDESGICVDRDNADDNIPVDRGATHAHFGLHERVWRILGFEPALQGTNPGVPQKSADTELSVTKLEPGDRNGPGAADGSSGTVCPGSGYWSVWTNTWSLNGPTGVRPDNSGNPRCWRPLYGTEKILLLREGSTFQLDNEEVYYTKDPLVQYFAGSSTAGGAVDSARWFAFRGKRAVGTVSAGGEVIDSEGNIVPADELEANEIFAVGRVAWAEGAHHGVPDPVGVAEYVLERWIEPRQYGFDFNKIIGEWASVLNDEWSIEVAPLTTFQHWQGIGDGVHLEKVWHVLGMFLLGTGTATGWSGAEGTDPTYTAGVNNPSEATGGLIWGGDVVDAEQGLGIPNQLVASLKDIREVFDEVPGANGGGLCRGRYAYLGSFESYKAIESILRPRGLMLSLEGNKYGVTILDMFDRDEASVTIGPDDLVDQNVRQRLRATGQLDAVELRHRWSPVDGSTAETLRMAARDPGARFRRGDFKEVIEDHGQVPRIWYERANQQGKPAQWERDSRELWEVRRPRFLSKRHFMVTIRVNRKKGQHLKIGTKVRATINWAVAPVKEADPEDAYGVSDAAALVMRVDLIPKNKEAYEVDLLIFAGQFADVRVFSPILFIDTWSGTTITGKTDANFLEHENNSSDGDRFEKPSWSDASGTLETVVMTYDRASWSIDTVNTRDATAGSGDDVTVDSGPPSTYCANADNYLIANDYDSQPVGHWGRAILLPTVEDDLQFGTGPTDGFPFVDA